MVKKIIKMRLLKILIILLTTASCNGQTNQDESNILSYKSFKLHTVNNDTIFRNCGYEFTVEPVDTNAQFKYSVIGGNLRVNGANRFKILIEANEETLVLNITDNNGTNTKIKFFCPLLPSPIIKQEALTEDSVQIFLEQPDKRLQNYIPRDLRYAFMINSTPTTRLKRHKEEKIDLSKLKVVRMNYRNETYEIQLKN